MPIQGEPVITKAYSRSKRVRLDSYFICQLYAFHIFLMILQFSVPEQADCTQQSLFAGFFHLLYKYAVRRSKYCSASGDRDAFSAVTYPNARNGSHVSIFNALIPYF